MTSADAQALIEEARSYPYHPGRLVPRLTDALEASEAARKDLTDKIEALADEQDEMAEFNQRDKSHAVASLAYAGGLRHAAARMRARLLVSGDKPCESCLVGDHAECRADDPDDRRMGQRCCCGLTGEERSDG